MPERAVLALLRDHWPLGDTPERISVMTGLALDDTIAALRALEGQGLVTHKGNDWQFEKPKP